MKLMVIIIVLFQIMVIAIIHSGAFGWTGEPSFDATNRETILRIAEEMVYFRWSPVISFANNWGKTFNGDEIYQGIAYTQLNEQENWAEFYGCVNSYSCCQSMPPNLGNDCLGFVSISWKLPMRYGTSNFISDAQSYFNENDFVHSLGEVGNNGKVNWVHILHMSSLS